MISSFYFDNLEFYPYAYLGATALPMPFIVCIFVLVISVAEILLTSNQHPMNLSVFRSMIFNFSFPQRNFEDTKEVVRSCQSTDKQYIGQTMI